MDVDPREKRICILGSGAAGLITAHTLIQDGFHHVEILTRDNSPGGVWAAQRVYPGLTINNVHGEFKFSPLPMPPPPNSKATGGRLTGEDMQAYMESFSDRFLSRVIVFNFAVTNIRRGPSGSPFVINGVDRMTGQASEKHYDKIVLCTGGCSEPNFPSSLSPEAATKAGFQGPVVHSSQFAANVDNILAAANDERGSGDGSILVIGGGKSAQDAASFLARRGKAVQILFESADPIVAAPIPLPDFIRKSRFLAIISPHIHLRTRLERFLHTTWLGGKVVKGIWSFLSWSSLFSLSVPYDSPLRRTHSLFWGVRTNDEGAGRLDGFHALVNARKIGLIAPARAVHYSHSIDAGKSIVVSLSNGNMITASGVVLGTGFSSSWTKLFDEQTKEDLGLGLSAELSTNMQTSGNEWNYASFKTIEPPVKVSPVMHVMTRSSQVYRGMVPAKNILSRDFAINGAIFTTNNGYTYEVCAHWISSYFLQDAFLRIPSSVDEAMRITKRNSAWLRKRYPGMLAEINESYSSDLAFWSWPQAVDDLLNDMGLPNMRSGGNWSTWPFKVIDLKEIEHLKEERTKKRLSS